MNKWIWILIIILILAGIGIYFLMQGATSIPGGTPTPPAFPSG